MKAYILTGEEIAKLASGETALKDLNLSDKEVRTFLIMPDLSMPEFAQIIKDFDGCMNGDELTKRFIRNNNVCKPYIGVVGKKILQQ